MEPPSQADAGQVAAPPIAPGPQMPGSSQAPALGHLDQVDPRIIWPHEALHFTPWLLDNAERCWRHPYLATARRLPASLFGYDFLTDPRDPQLP